MAEFTLSALDAAIIDVQTLDTTLRATHPAIRVAAATVALQDFQDLLDEAARELEQLFSPEPGNA